MSDKHTSDNLSSISLNDMNTLCKQLLKAYLFCRSI